MSHRIIVTGATGNIGAYLSLHLKAHGFDVIACGKRACDNGFFASHGIPYISVDICNKSDFSKLPQNDIFAVAHFAGELPSRYSFDPAKLIETIGTGTCNVLEYIRQIGVKKIVFPQTPFDIWYKHNSTTPILDDDVRGYPPLGDHSVYTIAKNTAVDLIEHYHNLCGLSRYILRFFTIYEYHPNPYHYADGKHKKMPYRILMDKAIASEPIEIWGDPSRKKEIVYIKDFCHLVQLCLESENAGGIYNVGGNQVSLEEQIKGIVEIFSPKNNPSKISYNPKKPNALEACLDAQKAEKELGYKPQFSYLEAMQDFCEEMKANRFEKLWGKPSDYKL